MPPVASSVVGVLIVCPTRPSPEAGLRPAREGSPHAGRRLDADDRHADL
jgi:hypothetical protein